MIEHLVSEAKVRAQIEAVLRAWGMPEGHVKTTTEIMVETDLRGVDSHGISMLTMYDQQYRSGQLQLDAEPRIVRDTPAAALIDGGAGLGHPVSDFAMRLAIEKAASSAIACVSVFNSHHFGAAGIYAEMAARADKIGMVFSTSKTVCVVPTRGTERVLGTNVMSLSAPSKRYLPVLLDMSTSVVAANKIKIYALADKDLPGAWVLDSEGDVVTDARRASEVVFNEPGGGLTPLGGTGSTSGGHKGYGLGLFAQILAGCMSGGSFSPRRNRSQKEGDPDNIGHLFVAIDPAFFRSIEAFHDDIDDVLETLKSVQPIDPDEPVLIPGDPEWEKRGQRQKDGIPMSEGLIDSIRGVAATAGAPFFLRPD